MATDLASLFNISWPILILVLVWTFIWKGIAMWKAAKKNHPIWFGVLLIANTLGILEILYIFLFSDLLDKKKDQGLSNPITSKKVVKKRKR